ncbi:30S ribosomal protein S6e [archaeon]|nr:30S ribosomal protein S6e [archaeon]|tara:strand:- start:2009 stop:2461 length:453 start_codon:yes stop_codon:yes gene_type:complete
MAKELDYKLVIGNKDGKTEQFDCKDEAAEFLMRKHIGDNISGDNFGYPGYEFLVTGGSDKAGFPMRKGIQQDRKRILAQKGVGISGKTRTKSKQKGLYRRKTVSGERITTNTRQINLKVIKQGPNPLTGKPAEEAKVEEKAEEKKEEKAE